MELVLLLCPVGAYVVGSTLVDFSEFWFVGCRFHSVGVCINWGITYCRKGESAAWGFRHHLCIHSTAHFHFPLFLKIISIVFDL